ncbi:guanylate-binding protein 5 [Callorhinchus milii]|uniref:Guanylate-binding protein 5-like n=1 Tax=Callorhinchus milii TaxID=7868 RepID=A0A4W3HIP8_CALMI|nr:guanylate-binding protein 5 [Callorhinchus milii]XP_042199924.1 guanylate-binding protein 5 [Callorhinchus milii]|eukprot:gi/632980325/ref/XP_007906971.1/ PREDICTED: guanylate-binding protein 5-like [Callorhinchus milii]
MADSRLLMEKPLPLLKFRESGEIIWEEATKTFLLGLDQIVETIGIMGQARSGKSYFANKLMGLSDEDSCFQVRPCGEATTKGIWVYCQEHPNKDGRVRMFLDTEGLQYALSTTSNETDLRIIFINMFVCGIVVLNMKDRVNQGTLELLKVAMKCIKFIKDKGQGEELELECMTPRDLYVLFRDNVDEDQDVQWEMEMALRVHQLEEDFTCCFDQCQARAIPFPSCNRRLTRNLLQASDAELNPEFVDKVAAVSQEILQDFRVKQIPCQRGQQAATVKDMIGIIEHLVALINESGSVFRLSSLYHSIAERQVRSAAKEAELAYLDRMEKQLLDLPLSEVHLYRLHANACKESREIFQKAAGAFLFKNDQLGNLSILEDHYRKYQQLNLEKSEKQCRENIHRLLQPLFKQVKRYTKDSSQLEADLYRIQHCYNAAVGNLPGANGILRSEVSKHRATLLLSIARRKEEVTEQRHSDFEMGLRGFDLLTKFTASGLALASAFMEDDNGRTARDISSTLLSAPLASSLLMGSSSGLSHRTSYCDQDPPTSFQYAAEDVTSTDSAII